MDSDYSVFSILPPYNTIHGQLLVQGQLLTTSNGYAVTYEAVADPDGSYNSTSTGKGNFYDFSSPLYGAELPEDAGLLQWPMPGTNNTPQPLLFEQTNRPAPGVAVAVNWFRAEGIPITPYDDAGRKNPYPLLRLVARNSVGARVATNDIVLPVSDEMDCRSCHSSGIYPATQPLAGWVWSHEPERDFRLNILRLHDQYQFYAYEVLYKAALADRGFNERGLYAGVVEDGKPVLCASCHASEALGTGSYSNTPPLTKSMHSWHAWVTDPSLGITLEDSSHRAACYRCHPGAATKCLRGAMGSAIAADGTMSVQCQSCHGSMTRVGSSSRVGWFMEPNCQSCHTGTALRNNGKIRYETAFDGDEPREPVDSTFATNPNTPASGLSLYRFSSGHGGLQCSACHGSTHAEFPSTHRNDNLRNEAIQGHAGVLVECTSCHTSMPVNTGTSTGGPHGLHPIGQHWADDHGDLIEDNPAAQNSCGNCHGTDGKGTVLALVQTARVIPTKENKYGTKAYWKKQTVSCYDCHDGPDSSDSTAHAQAVAVNTSTNTPNHLPVSIPLQAQGGGTLTLRIISQPGHGSVALTNATAIYFPEPGYTGDDQFTFAAWNGWRDSSLGTCAVSVTAGPASVAVTPLVPRDALATWPTPFSASVTRQNTAAEVRYEWDFGDDTQKSEAPHIAHVYSNPGSYLWSLVVSSGSASTTTNGVIEVKSGPTLRVSQSGTALNITWNRGSFDAVLESAEGQLPFRWAAAEGQISYEPQTVRFASVLTGHTRLYRLRKVF